MRKEGKIKEAVKIFTLNAQEYPNSTLVYESLGEIYKRNRNPKMAISFFEKARELDPENQHWNYILEKLKNPEK
ncbi:tetratricopeptide repeat protein [Flavobacterium sp.]|uniref:tetratricopeptide repeat protein n=1 Tax=Flavobacterium sp. TaxID=239 RepID=UPI003D0E61F0